MFAYKYRIQIIQCACLIALFQGMAAVVCLPGSPPSVPAPSHHHPYDFRHSWVASFRDSSSGGRPQRIALEYSRRWTPELAPWKYAKRLEFDVADEEEDADPRRVCRTYLGLAWEPAYRGKRIVTKNYSHSVIIKIYPKHARKTFMTEVYQQAHHFSLLESGTTRSGEFYLVSRLEESSIISLLYRWKRPHPIEL